MMTVREAYLTPNKWSRPGSNIIEVRAIVLHWFLAPGQAANSAVDWWDSRKGGANGYGSGHYALDDRETIAAVPESEIAYHVGSDRYTSFTDSYLEGNPNAYTISIELSHGDMSGRPSLTVWNNATLLASLLCEKYAVPEHMIVTHWDITGMRPYWNGEPCHKWFVTRPGELAQFRHDVKERR